MYGSKVCDCSASDPACRRTKRARGRHQDGCICLESLNDQQITSEISNYFVVRFRPQRGPAALFSGMPEWLKPLLYCQRQHGYSEIWLCSLYETLSMELLNEIKSATSSVVILVLHRMAKVHASSAYSSLTSGYTEDLSDSHTSKPWFRDTSQDVEDEDLKTYNMSGIAVMR